MKGPVVTSDLSDLADRVRRFGGLTSKAAIGLVSECVLAGRTMLHVLRTDGLVQWYSPDAFYALTPCTRFSSTSADGFRVDFTAATGTPPALGEQSWRLDLNLTADGGITARQSTAMIRIDEQRLYRVARVAKKTQRDVFCAHRHPKLARRVRLEQLRDERA